jgi:hypothetical protein
MSARLAGLAGLLALLLVGCHDARQGPCDEPIEPPAGGIIGMHGDEFPDPTAACEAPDAKLVHLVTFSMGPVTETLEGYMILRAPDSLRLYGMTESGQRAFDVACVTSNGKTLVNRIYRAPFLKDDRILDLVARATARIFLLRVRPLGAPAEHAGHGTEERVEREGVTFFYGGYQDTLRWLEGPGFSACFMDWTSVTDEAVVAPHRILVPHRIHYRSTEGPYPYTLTMKLVRAEALAKPAPDSLFEPPKKD